jgi:serine/threonine-protein kinase
MTVDITVPGYTILKKITDGGSASIFKAKKHPYDTMVALKVLLPQFVANKDMVRALDREGAVLLRLKHPNVIRCAGPVKSPRPTIELELFESLTVKSAIGKAGGKLPLRETAKIMTQAAEALSYVHTMQIAHLDVKPENLLVDEKLSLRLIDFSIARELKKSVSDRLRGIFGAKSTLEATIQGTITYLAPEMIRRADPGAKADVYALGLVLFECLTGGAPFRGHNQQAIMKQHLNDPPPALELLRTDVPEDVLNLYRSMLEKDPAKRPDATTAAQVLSRHAG